MSSSWLSMLTMCIRTVMPCSVPTTQLIEKAWCSAVARGFTASACGVACAASVGSRPVALDWKGFNAQRSQAGFLGCSAHGTDAKHEGVTHVPGDQWQRVSFAAW